MTTAVTNGTPLTHEEELALQQLQQGQEPSQVGNQQQQSAQQLSDVFTFNEYDADHNLEMRASISDVSRVYEDEAEHAGEESLRQEYEDLGAFKLLDKGSWKTVPDRLKLYFFREERKNKVKKDVMQKYETDGVDLSRTELTAAADRHERMLNEWNEFQDQEDRVKILMRNIQDDRIDALCREYLNHTEGMSDREFEDAFRAILAENPRAAKLIGKNLKHTASNILLKLRVERAYRNMMMGMLQSLETYATAQDKDAAKAAYESAIKQLVTEYVTLAQRGISPNLQKALQAPGEQIDAYRRWMRHEVALAKMQANTLKIKVDILGNGKAAYEVNNADKERAKFTINPLKWKPMHALNGLGKVLDKYPKTALAVSVGGTLALGIFNPAMAGFLAGAKGVAWIASKKTAHYTKEQKGQEKRLVRNLEEEKKRLAHLKDVADNTGFFKKFTSGWNRYKGTRHGELYAQTTQYEFIEDTDKVVKDIQEKMIALDQEALQGSVIEALARLDYYAMSGHNFLGQKEAKNMEQTMNTLQKLVVAGAETLGVTTQDLRNEEEYKTKVSHLDDMYSDVTKEFRNERRILALKYGAAAAAFSRGARALLGSDDIHKHTWFGADEAGKKAAEETANNTATEAATGATGDSLLDQEALKQIANEKVTTTLRGINPQVVIEHCKNINLADNAASRDIFAEMVDAGQCAPGDNHAVLEMVTKLATTGNLDGVGETMQDKVAYYLYHFAYRDAVLGEALKKIPETVLEDSVKNNSGGWLQAFGGGVETTVRFLGNLVASTSPVYANTFLENIEVDMTPKKNLDKTPRQANTPTGLPIPAAATLNTVVDPNLAPIPARWEDIDPSAWLIKPGDDTSWSVENQVGDVGITPASVDSATDEDNSAAVDSAADAEEENNGQNPVLSNNADNTENFKVGDRVLYDNKEYVLDYEIFPFLYYLKDSETGKRLVDDRGQSKAIRTTEFVKAEEEHNGQNPVLSNNADNTENFKVGDSVIYQGKEYTIEDFDTHPQSGRLMVSLKDDTGELLKNGGVKEYVFIDGITTPENLQKMIEFGKKYIKYPNESDSEFEKSVRENTEFDYYGRIQSLMKLMELEGEEKVTKVAQGIRKRYEDFLENLYLLNNGVEGDVSKYDKNGLARAYWDIAKQYYYFSHPETHSSQKYRGYTIGNPINDITKQQEIANRMSGRHIYRRYNEASRNDDKVWYETYSKTLQLHLPPAIYTQVKALLDKDPLAGREGTPKVLNELSSKDLALLGALINDNWVVGGHPDAIAAMATSAADTTASPDSAEPLSETAQGVEYFKELFVKKTTYNVQELKKALIDKFGDIAKNIYESLFRGYDFGDLKVQMKENGDDNSPMQYNRNKRIIYIQPEKLEKFVEKGHSLETLLSALGHEIIHDIVDINLKTQNKKKINNEAIMLLKMMKNQNSSNQRVNDIKKTLSDFSNNSKTRDYVYEEVLAYGLTDPAMKKYFKDNAQLKKQFEKILTTLEDTYKLSHLKDYYNATKNK